MGEHELKLLTTEVSLRTGLSIHCVRELLLKDWRFIERFDSMPRWEKVSWEERKAKNAKR